MVFAYGNAAALTVGNTAFEVAVEFRLVRWPIEGRCDSKFTLCSFFPCSQGKAL